MKKIKIAGVVIVIALIVLVWVLMRGSSEQKVSKLDAIDTVVNFYGLWLKAAQEPTTADPDLKTLAKWPILSKTLRDRLVNALKNKDTTPDPVLCQTVTPESISTRRLYENVKEAQVLVTSRDKNVTEQAIITLARMNDGWYIDNIDCAPGEFAPEREFSFEREGYMLKESMPPPYDPKNWHLVFEENGVPGYVVPIFFDSESECTNQDGDKFPCKPDQFQEAKRVFVQGQMKERGVSVNFLKLLK